jgi:hypothetical protein
VASKVLMPDGTPRVEYIRKRIAEGATRSQVAKELGVPYQVVFMATKSKKAKAVGEDPVVSVEEVGCGDIEEGDGDEDGDE